MKKKSFGLAAAVAVLIVLGGSYALLANHNRIQESESAAAESETGVAVATIASDKVSSFQLADGDTSFTLTKTDNSWICVQDETFPLSNDAASELVNTFTSLQAVRDLGTAQDGENYGFSPCCEYHTRNYECILVLLRGNAHLGSDNRGG